jgi:hypothetical protein
MSHFYKELWDRASQTNSCLENIHIREGTVPDTKTPQGRWLDTVFRPAVDVFNPAYDVWENTHGIKGQWNDI